MAEILVVTGNASLAEKLCSYSGKSSAWMVSDNLLKAAAECRRHRFSSIIIDSRLTGDRLTGDLIDAALGRNAQVEISIVIPDKERLFFWNLSRDGPCLPRAPAHSPSSNSGNRKTEPHRAEVCSFCKSGVLKESFHFQSKPMQEVYAAVEDAAGCDDNIMLIGETGVGKDVHAHEIHIKSRRRGGPFVIMPVSTFNENLVESILFGHAKGAFTGAQSDKKGLVEEAEGGTIYLPEFSSLSAGLQVKILYLAESKSFYRVGSNELRVADVRLISGWTLLNIYQNEEPDFRKDLMYRMTTDAIPIPPLKLRGPDIIPFSEFLLNCIALEKQHAPYTLSRGARNLILKAEWPGNIRQLKAALKKAAQNTARRGEEQRCIHETDINVSDSSPQEIYRSRFMKKEYKNRTSVYNRIPSAKILKVLEDCGGSKSAAAQKLGISRPTLDRLLIIYGIKG